MSIWLILVPLIAWPTAGFCGILLLLTPASRLWERTQITTTKTPFEPARWNHRFFVVQTRTIGALMLLAPAFLTTMALLVAVGVVPPVRN